VGGLAIVCGIVDGWMWVWVWWVDGWMDDGRVERRGVKGGF